MCADMPKSNTRPGFYYVSAVMGKRFWRMLGPFDNHEDALANVELVRRKACELNCWFDFAAFGTCRDDEDGTSQLEIGKLNDLFPKFNLATERKLTNVEVYGALHDRGNGRSPVQDC